MSPLKASPYHQPAAATFIGSRPLPIRAALKKLSDIKYTRFARHTTTHLPVSVADVDELLNTQGRVLPVVDFIWQVKIAREGDDSTVFYP